MKALKGVLTAALLVVSALLGGCDGGGAIASLSRAGVSDILDTDLPCVNAEELYEREKFSAPPELLARYGIPSGFDGTNIYFLRDSIPVRKKNNGTQAANPRTALIAYYDVRGGELFTLLEESSEKYIFYSFAGAYDHTVYYFRGEAAENFDRVTAQLYRISMYTKQPEKIIDFEMPHYPLKTALNSFCACEKSIYFSDGHYEKADGEAASYTIYRYNTQNGQIEEFLKGAKDPVPYMEGFAYFRESDEGLEIRYFNLQSGEDEAVTEPLSGVINGTGYSGGGDIFLEVSYYDDDENFRSRLGYVGSSDGFKEIAELYPGSIVYSITGKDILLLEIGGRLLIYDSTNRCFARLNINREYVTGFAAEASVLFIGYDDSMKNVVIYIYEPKGKEETL